MSMSKTSNTYNRQNWEDSEFPILCQTCLGDNPYIRMLKDKYGKECKICARPFTVFKWCPGAGMRYKKTEICQTCSRLKNVCQTCLLDLEFGLPVQVRDHAYKIKDEMPKSDVNKEFFNQSIEKQLASTDPAAPAGAVGKIKGSSDLLMKLARTAPYYQRNRPHICSFWVKGQCNRGEECPYRHDMPTDPSDPLSTQNIKDRYYGINDPVADKLMKRAESMPSLELPEDRTVTTLYVGGLEGRVFEQDLRDYFYQFGEIRQIHVVSKQNCAFVTFTSRKAAEIAAEASYNKLILNNTRLKVLWGKAQAETPIAGQDGGMKLTPVPGLPGALPPPPPPPPAQDPSDVSSSSQASSSSQHLEPAAISSAAAAGTSAAFAAPPPPPSQLSTPYAFPHFPGFYTQQPLPPGVSAPPPPPPGFSPSGHTNLPPPPPPGLPPLPQNFPFMPFLPNMMPSTSGVRSVVNTQPPPPPGAMHYPSQDPHRMGSESFGPQSG